MCVLSIKVPIRKKKSGNLFNDPRIVSVREVYDIFVYSHEK